MNPVRKNGLFSTMVDGQAVIYDAASNRTHCLNPLALKVWQLCDGRRDRDAIVHALGVSGGQAVSDGETGDLVDAAIERFSELGLLQDGARLDRRALGAAAMKGLAAGLVLSVMVPTRGAAASVDCESITNSEECDETPGCFWDGACFFDEP